MSGVCLVKREPLGPESRAQLRYSTELPRRRTAILETPPIAHALATRPTTRPVPSCPVRARKEFHFPPSRPRMIPQCEGTGVRPHRGCPPSHRRRRSPAAAPAACRHPGACRASPRCRGTPAVDRQGLPLVRFSTQSEPFVSQYHRTHPVETAHVEPRSGRV